MPIYILSKKYQTKWSITCDLCKDTEILTSTLAFWTAPFCVQACPQATLVMLQKKIEKYLSINLEVLLLYIEIILKIILNVCIPILIMCHGWKCHKCLRIDRNLCSVHEEITSIRLYTTGCARVCTTWLSLFRMNRTNNFDQSL